MQTHSDSCPWQSWTEPQQTKAFQLGGLGPPRPDNKFQRETAGKEWREERMREERVREERSLRPTLFLIGPWIKALSLR